ncbi:DedA family protein [Campylobacter sp. JMF_08 NE1]|uniref:DedA family protein n=1 Tax=Campylobacter sp. JMF_08 NE1 TaxID=2983821 RepID=UPI0022E998B3|nr:DedA family protein [Campylobacter sp. JMF_08 NE1]MDA3047558.1 DedA family protein [Campylobacter sp. JMF_08 NE1]
MEETLKEFLTQYHQYAYIVLFAWCALEGEIALVLGGILAHEGHINLPLGIFVAACGAFAGDQFYFYIGRYNKNYISKKLATQRRKFAIAHLLLQRWGWILIFIQRYMYGLRMIIPMSIGITRYSAKKFAFINFLSAIAWASMTMIPAWYFGKQIWQAINLIEQYWYFAIPLIAGIVFGFYKIFARLENHFINLRKDRDESNIIESKF